MIKAARDAGISSYVARQIDTLQLGSHLHDALKDTRRFITASRYTGPDRRYHDGFEYCGSERRGLGGIKSRLAMLNRYDAHHSQVHSVAS